MVEFTAVIVITRSLVVVVPPRLVPKIVMVCSLTYPVPAACRDGVYFHPLRITVNDAPTPEPV